MRTELGATFDAVAALYDATRPTYPAALVDAVISATELPPLARILEIGVGTGQATDLFARRGYQIYGLEPGRSLAVLAAHNLALYPNVTLESVSFEDWPIQGERFDLVMSAQAFHWVAPEIGYVKAAQALKPGGCIALFWNMPPASADLITQEIDAVYDRIAPEMAANYLRQPLNARIAQIESDIQQSGLFEDVTVQQFPWAERYETARYLDLLETYSDHRVLATEKRIALFGGIAEVLTKYGGDYDKPYIAVLYLARKK